MSPLVEKAFMLQRHQLIRWGSPNGYVLITIGLVLMLTPIGTHIYVRGFQADLEGKVADGARMRLERLARLETEDQLRTFATLSVKELEKVQMSYQEYVLKSLGIMSFIALGGGMMFLYAGMLSFQAGELASGLEEESRKADILNRH